MRKSRLFALITAAILGISLATPLFALPLSPTSSCGWDTAAGWVARENLKSGNANWAAGIPIEYAGDYARRDQQGGFDKWVTKGIQGKRVEGWFDSASATCGQTVGMHISGNAKPVKIFIYRMGYYGGANARLVGSYKTQSAVPSYDAPIISSAPRSTVSTNWPVSYKFKVTKETPPGQYLFRLDDGEGKSTFVPLMITNPNERYGITFVSAVMTWQAYNQWGGYSLYKGPDGKRTSRSTVASFNRPYDGDGSGQTRYMELPILRLAEMDGLDINYATDFEVDQNNKIILQSNSIVFGGHDEYWTNNMRDNLEAAVARGTNLINFGGNAGYNRLRLETYNRIAMWRSSKGDPYGTVADKATTAWRLAPIKRPESLLLGAQYIGLGVSGSYTVTHPDRWPFNAMTTPTKLELVVGKEVDSPLYSPGPAVENLASSDIKVHGVPAVAMATYYTNSKSAGVLNISTNGWPCSMGGICPWHAAVPANVRNDVKLVTEAILIDAAKGPLGKHHPMKVDIPARTVSTKFSESA